MNTDLRLSVELQLPGQRIQNMLILHNESIEKQVESGIQAAMKQLEDGHIIEAMISEKVKEMIVSSIRTIYYKSEIHDMISSTLRTKMSDKIDKIAELLLANISPSDFVK